MTRFLFLAALFVGACSRSDDANRRGDTASVTPPVLSVVPGDSVAAQLTCGVTPAPMLTEEGIGELKQGRPVSEIAALCEITSDATEAGSEGMAERVLVVQIAGETVRALVTDDRISRIEVNTPRFRTIDSLGVDAPLKLIAAKRGAQFAPGEDGVYAFVPDHCGLRFRFSLPLRPPAGGQWTASRIGAAHGDAAVDRVLVTACRK